MQAATRIWKTPMIPDAQHTWMWTVHLKVPGGNHRALVLQTYMTKSIQNSFLTIEFVSWWSFQQTSTNSSFLLVNPAKMLPNYADVPEPTACSKLSQTGFHCWTGSSYYIMLYRLRPPLENKECPWTYPPNWKLPRSVVSKGPILYKSICCMRLHTHITCH